MYDGVHVCANAGSQATKDATVESFLVNVAGAFIYLSLHEGKTVNAAQVRCGRLGISWIFVLLVLVLLRRPIDILRFG